MANLAVREQRRIGRELHDGLGQHLTGISLMAKSLQRRLEAQSLSDSKAAAELCVLVQDAQNQLRTIIRGLHPVDVDAEGLMSALAELVASTETLSGIKCTFEVDEPVRVEDNDTATQLFYIAQEATRNSVRHANPQHLLVRLENNGERLLLEVRDDGVGIQVPAEKAHGMGRRIMQYRAELIGGALNIESRMDGGTVVTCTIRRSTNDVKSRHVDDES